MRVEYQQPRGYQLRCPKCDWVVMRPDDMDGRRQADKFYAQHVATHVRNRRQVVALKAARVIQDAVNDDPRMLDDQIALAGLIASQCTEVVEVLREALGSDDEDWPPSHSKHCNLMHHQHGKCDCWVSRAQKIVAGEEP